MTKKFNQNYIYKPKKNLTIEEVVNGVLKADTKVLAQAITMLESKNQKDRLLIYDAKYFVEVSFNILYSKALSLFERRLRRSELCGGRLKDV